MVLENSQKSFEISNSLLQEMVDLKEIYERIELEKDKEISEILENNSISTKKKIAVMIELLRREDGQFDHQLRTYLFTLTPVSEMI
ncbi:MAG: hypothetical protein NE328_02225 [Lentisphaeraceae bacterium]|nr:hypothetical protein [Lentisphaeraceae bacterium]